tara:strand:- start:388 stop:1710 length:1323 start_codon:yes stop_codon:yes gene_type:complete
MAIILRQTKGSELTFAEVDGNFSSLFYSASLQGTFLNFYTWEDNLSQSFDLSALPGFGGVTVQDDGVTVVSVATGLNFIGSGVTVTQVGSNQANIEFTGGGDTYTLQAGAKVNQSIPLNLNAAAGVDSTVNLTEGTGITLTQTSATEITIDSAGGNFINSTALPQNFPGNSPFDNISTGTSFPSPGKSFQEMMDLMLYPTLFPTLSNPQQQSFTLSPNGFREIGEVFSIGAITLTSTFNRGSINPAYGTNGFRSGLPNAYIYTGGGSITSPQSSTSLSNNTSNTVSYTVVSGYNNWTSAISYDQGPQPLDSTGNNFNTPLPAGTTSSITRNIRGVYPTFATTVNISTLTKQTLQSMTFYEQVSMVAETGGNKQIIEIPVAWSTITGLQQFNTFSGTWDSINLSQFTITSVTNTIQGNVINYNRYTHNGATIGARQLRFTV